MKGPNVSDKKPRSLDDVPGWFRLTDQLLFEWILSWQKRNEPPGDLVELGVYQGKSAIHMARLLQDGERFTVCDLFDDARDEATIREDARHAYRTLSQQQFEDNYLAFHPELPVVVRGLSSQILQHVEPTSCRFMHIDASHMYEHVREDTAAARKLLRSGGVVVFDDYRTEHTLGTAAAVWEALITDDLHPICASAMKLYATWGDAAPLQREIFERVASRTDHTVDVYTIFGQQRLLRVVPVKAPAKQAAKPAPAPAPAPATQPTPAPSPAKAESSNASALKQSRTNRLLRRARTVARRYRR